MTNIGRATSRYVNTTADPATLIPYAKNARDHSPSQILAITKSIKEFGFTNPILIDEQRNIIAGFGRYLASKKLELTDVPCIVVTGLTAGQKRALAIADNKIAISSSWNSDLLIQELGDIQSDGIDLGLTGFDEKELSAMLMPMDTEDDQILDLGPASNAITVTVPNEINIPSVAALIRKTLKTAGYKGVKIKEPR